MDEIATAAGSDASARPLRITGLILAGGLGERMACAGVRVEKGLLPLDGRPLVEHAIARLRPQVQTLLISANRELPRYRSFGYPVVVDGHAGHPGPLAGIHAGLRAAQTDWLAVIPCDCPFAPRDLVDRLERALRGTGQPIAIARNQGRTEPAFMLLHRRLAPSIDDALHSNLRGLGRWAALHDPVAVDFDDHRAFMNLNTPEELSAGAVAELLCSEGRQRVAPPHD